MRTLVDLGFRVRAVNYHSVYGEVDIVAEDGGDICFVEVKARRSGAAVAPLEAVTTAKQRRIIRTALCWLQENDCGLQPRFDVFAVTLSADGTVAEHDYLRGAFCGEPYEKDN